MGLVLVVILFLSPGVHAQSTPIIAAASSTQFALKEISQHFTQETGLSVKFSFGSSGNLMHQIYHHSPYELFISADEVYVFKLHQAGLTVDQGVRYARGRLVLFTGGKPEVNTKNLVTFLHNQYIKHLAIANPEHAPYGRAAKQVLKKLNVWETLQKKLVFGENVAQTAQFSRSHAVQVGIFAYSFALHMGLKQTSDYILIPASLHQPLIARMVLLKQASATTQDFYQYLQQPKAQDIFKKHGFLTP